MRVELESIRGRSGALRVSGEEASRRGVAWRGEEVLRYAAIAKAPAEPPSVYHSDELRELMAQSIVATSRRVKHALHEASRARHDSERAEFEANINFEQAFPPRRTDVEIPIAEQAARRTTRSILVGANRAATKLRVALTRLEEEAATAQVRMSCLLPAPCRSLRNNNDLAPNMTGQHTSNPSTMRALRIRQATRVRLTHTHIRVSPFLIPQELHATDMRALSARLVAEREAATACLLESLRSMEFDSAFSLSGLQEELRALHATLYGERGSTGDTLTVMRAALEEVRLT